MRRGKEMFDIASRALLAKVASLEIWQRGVGMKLVPLGAVVWFSSTAADFDDTDKFDKTGLGTGDFDGWARCNGANGTETISEVQGLVALQRIA